MNAAIHRNRRRGSSLIETALLLPVAVLLCLGGLEFSRIYIATAQLEAAATVAASEAARRPDDLAPARDLALADLPASGGVSVEVEIVCACAATPEQWGSCEAVRCGAGERRRYARALAESEFQTVGRYLGVQAPSRLRREHFVRAE